MKLTRTEYRTRADRVRLHVDGEDEPRLEIAADLFLKSGLATGDEVSESDLDALRLDDQVYRGREAALSLLAQRARAREELRRRLRRKEFEDPVIDEVLAWLEARDYLDDDAFAEAFVRDRLRLRPRGRLGLIRELRKKGVDGDTAEAAIGRVMEEAAVDEPALARDVAEAWARKNGSAMRAAGRSGDGRRKARRRLYAHLARRGFAGDAISAAIDAVFAD